MKQASQFLRELSSKFEHRGSTTANERRAATWIAGQLEHMGCDVRTEEFRAPAATLYTGPPVIGLLLVLVSLLTRYTALSPFVGAAICLVALVPLLGEVLLWPINLDAVLPRHRSQNVIARMGEAARPGPSDFERPDKELPVVVTAHYDTQKAGPLFHPTFRPFISIFLTTSYGGFFGVPLAVLAFGIWPASVLVAVLLYITITIALAASAFLLVCNVLGRPINGANDNSSGTSVALAAAARLTAQPLPGLDVTFVFTGAEEVGTRGMIAFMNRHRGELSPDTVFVNVDNVGGGILRYLTEEGMLVPVPYSERLIEHARQATNTCGCELRPKHNLFLPTDGLIPAHRGFPALTLIAFDETDSLPHYHWYDDTLDTVDLALVDQVAEVVWELFVSLLPS